MKFILPLLMIVLLSACAPTLTPAPLPTLGEGVGGEGATPTPAPTETPTPTPVPTYTIEQLQAMTSEQKLAIAPLVTSAPADVVSNYLPKGADAAKIAWGEKTLTFWERVVAYNGTTADGQTVTMYFDLESGQWAKKYASFDEAAKIPADQVPDVMVLTDAVMGDDRLLRAKLQYDYDWISQPQVMIDGKKVFRDEKGYPKAVFDTVSKKWLTPKEADVVWTWEKWQPLMEAVTYTGFDGKKYTINMLTYEDYKIITDPNEILTKARGENPFLILNPSGIITAGDDRNSIAARLKEGATVITYIDYERSFTPVIFIRKAVGIARNAYEAGYRDVRVEVGESKENLEYNDGEDIWLKDLITLTLEDGTVVTPILLMPPHFKLIDNNSAKTFTLEEAGLAELNLVNWLDQILKAGFKSIDIYIQ